MKILLDCDGYPKITNYDADDQILVDFIEGDIQRSIVSTNDFLNIIKNVRSGFLENWSGTWNAHTTTVKCEGIIIENEFSGEVKFYESLEYVENYLKTWKFFLQENI